MLVSLSPGARAWRRPRRRGDGRGTGRSEMLPDRLPPRGISVSVRSRGAVFLRSPRLMHNRLFAAVA